MFRFRAARVAQAAAAAAVAPARSARGGARRALNLHENQSMALMRGFGVPVPGGAVATTPAEAEAIFKAMAAAPRAGGKPGVVVKAQVLAGGRGLGHFVPSGFKGGVHVVADAAAARAAAGAMLGSRLVTKQTGDEGRPCAAVYLMERVDIAREAYLSITLDRAAAGPVLVVSPRGGTSIEDVAHEAPDAIKALPVSHERGPTRAQLDDLGAFAGFGGSPATLAEFRACVEGLWKMFLATDATMVEVNPLAETPAGKVFVCDAKIGFDDNAAFRQEAIFKLRDFSQEDAREVEASKSDLNYIGLDGSIGCMVNGAGLAMATMDIIKLHGGAPANFLDVGGGATAEQVTAAFKLLNADPKVKAVLVNIFGGIMRCDTIAEGIITAARVVGLRMPLVVRLEGTNVEQGKAALRASGIRVITADDLDDAAKKAVAALAAA